MEIALKYSDKDMARMEIQQFVNHGLKDVYEDNLVDAEEVFDKLEKRYKNEPI